MIGKIAPKGRGFRGLAEYLLQDARGRIVAGPLSGRTPRALAAELGVLRRLNPRLTKAVAHLMLSPAPGDPPMSADKWRTVAERYMDGMGFSDAPWVAVVHDDTDHQHLHLMASRIRFDGTTVSEAHDYRKSEALVRGIEAEFGLVAVTGSKEVRAKRAGRPGPRSAGHRARRPRPTPSTPQEMHPMSNSPVPPNPFEPGHPQFETWPEPFEPGRDSAELAMALLAASPHGPGASNAEPLTKKAVREAKRRLVEDDYPSRMRAVLGDDLTRVHRHPQGATLYFKQPGRIADEGHRLSVFGEMEDRLAAQRVVALGQERGWKSITFTGSAAFVEHAMRAALHAQLEVITSGEEQAEILAKVMAERRGGMGSMAAVAPRRLPAGAVPADDGLGDMLAELDDLDPRVGPRVLAPIDAQPESAPQAAPPSPPAAPAREPVVGVLPRFVSFKDRLRDRREQQRTPAQPHQTRPPQPKP